MFNSLEIFSSSKPYAISPFLNMEFQEIKKYSALRQSSQTYERMFKYWFERSLVFSTHK